MVCCDRYTSQHTVSHTTHRSRPPFTTSSLPFTQASRDRPSHAVAAQCWRAGCLHSASAPAGCTLQPRIRPHVCTWQALASGGAGGAGACSAAAASAAIVSVWHLCMRAPCRHYVDVPRAEGARQLASMNKPMPPDPRALSHDGTKASARTPRNISARTQAHTSTHKHTHIAGGCLAAVWQCAPFT